LTARGRGGGIVARNYTPAGIAVVSLYHITNTCRYLHAEIYIYMQKDGNDRFTGRKGFKTLSSDMREFRKHKLRGEAGRACSTCKNLPYRMGRQDINSRKACRRHRQRAGVQYSQRWQAAGREEGRHALTLMENRRGGRE
jgi:hypothetical protein